jgi:hypothetical protein
MQTETIEIKSKGQTVGEFDYSYPETLSEALDLDGEEKVYKLYAMQRKIRAVDTQRRVLTGGGLPKSVVAALKNADPAVLARIAEELGVDLA